jgi:hypothetical protein
MSGLTIKSPQANRSEQRKGPFGRLPLLLLAGLTVSSAMAADASFGLEGGEYRPAGILGGDQVGATISLKSGGGLLVWQDNTDGDGLAIRSRLLGSQFSGLLQPNYVNDTRAGDQERPAVVTLADGGYFIAWQSGVRGAQKILGRVVSPTGVFASGEITVSGTATDNRGASLAVLNDGSVVVAWTADEVDGHMGGVQIRRLSSGGEVLSQPQTVNDFTQFSQRDPAVVALANGGFAVVWVSEQQAAGSSAALYAKSFGSDGQAATGEVLLAGGKNPAASPVAVSTAAGFLVAWSEFKLEDNDLLWDITARAFGAQGTALGNAQKINTYGRGNQLKPRMARAGDAVLITYESIGVDGSGLGIAAQFVTDNVGKVGEELVVNSQAKGDQFSPSVASDGIGRFLVVWSRLGSADSGLELQAQRFNREQAPLTAPSAPYLLAVSSSRLTASWPHLDGLAVERYEVHFDGLALPLKTTDNLATFSQLAPASSHEVRLAYVLKDGRKSPLSEAATATTWAEDDNADGLPDDWQAAYFGDNSALWPDPGTDTDGDGMSDRSEFLSGTNPQAASSVLKTTLTSIPQGSLLSWNSVAGAFYQVQYSADLKSWENLGGRQLSTGSTSTLLVSDVPSNSYFRVNFLR